MGACQMNNDLLEVHKDLIRILDGLEKNDTDSLEQLLYMFLCYPYGESYPLSPRMKANKFTEEVLGD